ncbi:protein arginine kinase activator [Natranaerovirga hydrolytica]|uniref:Protein arginine kinase activator n=1 Tax=Natranaerovirga hydrolytica TaxID=680378 RepID=A0A4R1MKA8_9FIRM|nr:UvrB/UvrC motif-containing protein [Natranaerovirga hydrolytica]TCK92460.1 protein arginine kinase activator [Natranaerovirga hydrolytica]
MLCNRCGQNQASVYLTKIINGKKTEVHLCEQCASESENVYMNQELSFQNLFSGLLDIAKNPQTLEKSNYNIQCPECKLTYDRFKKTGKFGCSNCYKTFDAYLPPILKRIHGNYVHTGKIPNNAEDELIKKRKVEDLRKSLKEAILKEEFEQAAELRDEIKSLEKGDDKS